MRITIVGTGYVGLTTGVCLASIGHQIICVDVLSDRVSAINSGKAPFYEPGLAEMLSAALANRRLEATTDLASAVAGSELTLIAVGTPQIDGEIDLSYIAAAARQVGRALRGVAGYHVVAVKSTVVPGTTDTLVRSLLEENSGLTAGEYGLCMNPEFLREGTAIEDFMSPDRIVIGQMDDRAGQVMAEVYSHFDCPKIFTTTRNAEMIKYTSNALLATLISFSNEIAAVCEATPGTDAEVVLGGAHLDRRLSPVVNGERVSPGILSFLRAGCGFGGSCLPKDVNALRAYARERNVTPHMLDAAININSNRATVLSEMAEEALGSLHGATIAVLGVAFKPFTDDVRESPAVRLIQHLQSRQSRIRVYDPVVGAASLGASFNGSVTVCRQGQEALKDADAALIVTAWPEFTQWNWAALCDSMRTPIIIDGRNALTGVAWPHNVRYLGIGRVHESSIKQSVALV